MGKLRHRILPSKCLIQQYMQGGRRQPLLTTNHMGNFHQMVIHNICQMIGRQLVGTLIKHLIVENIALHAHVATNQVIHHHLLSSLDLKAHHILLTIGNQLLHLLLRQCQRVTHHTTGMTIVLEILYLLTLSLQFLRGIKGDIGFTSIQQLLHILLVDVTALTLAVGTLVTTETHTFVKPNPQPLERLDNIFLSARHETVRIGILYSEDQVATMLLGKQIIIQGSAHTADMQSPRRTWCKAHPNSSFRHKNRSFACKGTK